MAVDKSILTALTTDPFFQDAKSPTVRVQRGNAITNLENIATTWGQFIPETWGNVRVGGYQVWASGYYKLLVAIDRVGVAYGGYNTDGSTSVRNTGSLISRDDKTTYAYDKPAIDVAYSFGKNGLRGSTRIVSKLRADNQIIYDATTGLVEEGWAFNVYQGAEGVQDPVIQEYLGDLACFYPDQIVVVFSAVTAYGNKNYLPRAVDIEFRTEETTGETVVVSQLDSVPPGPVFPDYTNRVFYVYRSTPNFGSFDKYDMDTMLKISSANVVLTGNAQSDGVEIGAPLYGAGSAWFPEARVVFAQQDYFGGRSRVRAIDPETGKQLGAYGFNEQNFGSRDNFEVGGQSRWNEIEIKTYRQGANGGAFYAGELFGNATTLLFYEFTGNAGTGSVAITATIAHNKYIDHENRGIGGTDGKVFGVTEDRNGIYVVSSAGPEPVLATRPTDGPEIGWLVRYKDLVLSISTTGLICWDTSGTLVYSRPMILPAVGNLQQPRFRERSNVLGGTIGWVADVGVQQKLFIVDIPAGTLVSYPVTDFPDDTARPDFWDSPKARAVLLLAPTRTYQLQAPRKELGGSILLRDFLRSLYTNTGKFTAEQVKFLDINDTILGAFITKGQTLGAIVQNVCRLFRLERLENDTGITFYRGAQAGGVGGVVATIPIGDLALVSDSDDDRAALVSTIGNAEQAVAEVKLTFIDPDNAYQENTVVWRRPDAPVDATTTADISVPLVMTKSTAISLVQVQFAKEAGSVTTHKFRMPPRYAYLGSGDVIRIDHGSFSSVVRIITDDLNADFSVTCEAENVSLSATVQVAVPDVPTPSVPDDFGTGATQFLVADTSALIPDHLPADQQKMIQYMDMYGAEAGWSTGYLARKEADQEWASLFSSSRSGDRAVYRVLLPMPGVKWETSPGPYPMVSVFGTWDEANDTDPSVLYADGKRNLALYGAPGRWEIVQFAGISSEGVRGVMRGMRGTEWAMPLHEANDILFVIGSSLVTDARNASVIDMTEQYKAVSGSEQFGSVQPSTHMPKGHSLRPWAPADVRVVRDAGSGDAAVSWTRRDRAQVGWGVHPMSEATETYDVEIYSEGGALLRTFASQPPGVLNYGASQQASDGTASASKLGVAVYQNSAVVGRGYTNKVLVDVQ